MEIRDVKTECEYDNNGVFLKVEIHIPYSDLKTFKLPKSCTNCSCGYMYYGCGRNVPFETDDYVKRPSTCKLELISIEDIIKKIGEINQ